MDTTPNRGPAAPAALLLAALLLDGCASVNPTPAPALHDRLDLITGQDGQDLDVESRRKALTDSGRLLLEGNDRLLREMAQEVGL